MAMLKPNGIGYVIVNKEDENDFGKSYPFSEKELGNDRCTGP